MALTFDKTYKDKVGVQITVRIGQGIKNGELPETELPEVCSYVLVAFETMGSVNELLDFLRKLSARWPMFTDIYQNELKNAQAVAVIEQTFADRQVPGN